MRLREQAKHWMRSLFAWDVSEKQRLVRAATAKGLGLEPQEYVHPFPGTPVNVYQATKQSALRHVPAILAGLALGLTSAGVGWMIATQQKKPVEAAQPDSKAKMQGQGWEWQIEYKSKDGEWKVLGEPMRMIPSGK